MPEIPTRKHCSTCRRWLLTCINFHVHQYIKDADGNKIGIKRLQSRCISCAREATRIAAGRRRRGFRYEPRRKRTPEQKAAARRRRYRAKARALREDDRLVSLKPFSKWLEQKAQEIGMANLANELRMDASHVNRLIAGVDVVVADRIGGLVHPRPQDNGRNTVIIKRWVISLSMVDEALTRFEESLWDLYPALFDQ